MSMQVRRVETEAAGIVSSSAEQQPVHRELDPRESGLQPRCGFLPGPRDRDAVLRDEAA